MRRRFAVRSSITFVAEWAKRLRLRKRLKPTPSAIKTTAVDANPAVIFISDEILLGVPLIEGYGALLENKLKKKTDFIRGAPFFVKKPLLYEKVAVKLYSVKPSARRAFFHRVRGNEGALRFALRPHLYW